MKKSKSLMIVVGCVLCCCSAVLAHDVVSPNDPSVRFERVLYEGYRSIEKNSVRALFFSDDVVEARSIYDRAAIWTNKAELTVCFWNGAVDVQNAVEKSALRWNGVSRINFVFRDGGGVLRKCLSANDADIRVSLNGGDGDRYESTQSPYGNWSLIGRQGAFVPSGRLSGSRYDVTLNLPFVASNLAIGDYARMDFTVGHEFGHALGLLHEFQSSRCKGWIDIGQLAKDQGWSSSDAEYNLSPLPEIAGRFRIDLGMSGDYDGSSIMQYNFPHKYYVMKIGQLNPCMLSGDISVPSKGDKATIVAMYGALGEYYESPLLTRAKNARLQLFNAYKFSLMNDREMSEATGEVLSAIKMLDDFEKGK